MQMLILSSLISCCCFFSLASITAGQPPLGGLVPSPKVLPAPLQKPFGGGGGDNDDNKSPGPRQNNKYTTKAPRTPTHEKGQPKDVDRNKFVLTSDQIQTLKGNCAKKSGGCKGQSDKAKAVKKHVHDSLVQDLLKGGKILNPLDAVKKATEILDSVLEAKRALYDTQGLNGIEPDNDGLWQGDMQLNLEQTKYIINEVTGQNPPPVKLPKKLTGGKEKRFSVFMESFPSSKWNLPIGYVVGSDLAYNQAGQVRAAIAQIQRKTCIRFYEDTSSSSRTPYILYRPYTSGAFCGQSPVGNQGGVNTVWLNFNCDGGNIIATIIHETMHSLGAQHQHVRVDRDDFITVDWNNIDPQSYDLFDGRPYVNSYSTYGVPYDYFSVMHYHAYVTSYNGQANMIPKIFPATLTRKLGQRIGMSDRDAELLRKMYCMPDCNDYHVWCGWWSTQNYCLDPSQFDYMRSTCPKSCGFCPEGVL